MKKLILSLSFAVAFVSVSFAQCTTSDATSCVCLNPAENDCDLLPDITIEWDYAEGSNTEYAPGASNTNRTDGRLTVSGHTPNMVLGLLI